MNFSFKPMNFNKSKWLAFLFFITVMTALSILGIGYPDTFKLYSNQISILSTLIYVYLTYEILRETRQGITLPYINVKFILSSKLDDDFLKSHQELVISDRVRQLIEDFKKPDPSRKDLVFAMVENIGETTAIEVKLDLGYDKQVLGQDSSQDITLSFGTLKMNQSCMELVDYFDTPGKNDFFKIKRSETLFNTVGRKHSSDGPRKNSALENLTYKNADDGLVISFKKK